MPNDTSNPRVEANARQAAEVAYRGVTKTFEFGFWQDDARTVPITPANSTRWPRVQVIDADGEVVLTAVPPSVRPSSAPGYWVYEFTVPADAELTSLGRKWEFAAEITTSGGRTERYRTTFAILDPTVVKATEMERYFHTISGKGVQIMYRSLTELHHIEVNIPVGNSETENLLTRAQLGSGPYDIRHKVSTADGIHVYYLDIPYSKVTGFTERNLTVGSWKVFWSIQESAADAPELVYAFIEVLDRGVLDYVREVRYVVDKLEKRRSTRQAVRDADVFSGITNGLRLVNSTMPYTTFTLDGVPEPFKVFVILGAAYYVYCGQLGLAVDLQFNFSGQTTVLDQDQTGGLESLLERYRGELRDNLAASKQDALRHMRSVGTVATRPTRARHMYNRVFRISSGSSSDLLGFLNSLGLI